MWLLLLLWGSWAPTAGASRGIPVSRFCPVLEFWDLDHRCCRRCVERFGLPSCQDYEVSPNCGLSDFGDHLGFPFVRCSQGMCNKGRAQKCGPCLDRTLPQAPVPPPARDPRYRRPCPKEAIPPRSQCPRESAPEPSATFPATSSLASGTSLDPDSLGPSSPSEPWGKRCSPSGTPFPPNVTSTPQDSFSAFAGTVWYVVGITALLWAGLLLWAAWQTFWARAEGEERVAEAREMCKLFPLTEGSVPLTLACQPLSRLLDELEVLEELVVLLDPEPGPSGGSTWGTTRHLAARYGLPASWATFAYSLRPAHSPLRALLETVAARDPAAQLGQLADHLSQLGRGDALNVLLKLR